MSCRHTLLTATSTTVAATLAASLLCISPALAQEADIDAGTDSGTDSSAVSGSSQPSGAKSGSSSSPGLDSILRSLVVNSSQSSAATSGSSLEGLLSSLRLAGSSEFRLSSDLVSINPGYPKPIDESITTAEVISRVPESGRVERWTVASPAMARNVEVQVMRPADASAPAPMLYLLDGVEAGRVSEWLGPGQVETFFADENVTLVMPTEAMSSMYSDWGADDPVLGRHQWETIITEELAPLLEAEEDLNFNGRRGIGGLSMGATGAVHLANSRPDMFDGVFGISGCYSTMSNVGRQTAQITVASRGGTLENMWGPFGSDEWLRHDVTRNPEGLRNMAVYLSAANGEYSFDPDFDYSDIPPSTITSGIQLEQGAYLCTRELEDAMEDAGMEHQVIEYTGAGVHDWDTFGPQLAPAWETIRPSLY